MPDFLLKADDITHSFTSGKCVVSNISLELSGGQTLGIAGRNGSGKSTLVKILCGALTPVAGRTQFVVNGRIISRDDFRLHSGLVAPYLTLYEEFTPDELCQIIQRIRGLNLDAAYLHSLLDMFSIALRRSDIIKTFSSGMKQRVKFILAALHRPLVLFLDEPSSNLDAPGRLAFTSLMQAHLASGGGIILATNEPNELSLCDSVISVE